MGEIVSLCPGAAWSIVNISTTYKGFLTCHIEKLGLCVNALPNFSLMGRLSLGLCGVLPGKSLIHHVVNFRLMRKPTVIGGLTHKGVLVPHNVELEPP